MTEAQIGLEDVVIGNSSICFIDGDKGILQYRGYNANQLAEKSNFEEVCFLLIYGHLPTQKDFEEFKRLLRADRHLPNGFLKEMQNLPPATNAMARLRTLASVLESYDSEGEVITEVANVRRTIRLTAQLSVLAASIERVRKGLPTLEPLDDLDHAANFLYMLNGKKPPETSRRAMDMALILQADHELNASTFAGCVTVSTLSDMYSAVVSAIGTLKGPLHGGANKAVMEMLEEIGSVENVEPYIKARLLAKKKIMGFGHRVYTTLDPRAAVLKEMSRKLSVEIGPAKWFEISDQVQKMMSHEKNINANLDFYSATVFHYLGISTDMFPVIFAISRIVGWCTHFIEQYNNNRLIRPTINYTGRRDQSYVPIAERKSESAPVKTTTSPR
jgi:citrate synthase